MPGKSVSLIFTAFEFLFADQVKTFAPWVKENVPKLMCHIKENSTLGPLSLCNGNKKYITAINKSPLAKSVYFIIFDIKTCNVNTIFL